MFGRDQNDYVGAWFEKALEAKKSESPPEIRRDAVQIKFCLM